MAISFNNNDNQYRETTSSDKSEKKAKVHYVPALGVSKKEYVRREVEYTKEKLTDLFDSATKPIQKSLKEREMKQEEKSREMGDKLMLKSYSLYKIIDQIPDYEERKKLSKQVMDYQSNLSTLHENKKLLSKTKNVYTDLSHLVDQVKKACKEHGLDFSL